MNITVEKLKLNRKEIEFVQPIKCECGCGSDLSLVAKTQDELINAMCSILNEFNCDCCLGLAFNKEGKVIIADKFSEQIFEIDQFTCIKTIKEYVEGVDVRHMLILSQTEEDTYDFIY